MSKVDNTFSGIIPESIKEKQFDNQVNKANEIFNKLKIIHKNNPELLNKIKKQYQEILQIKEFSKSKESIK
jgi:hypothetical protein